MQWPLDVYVATFNLKSFDIKTSTGHLKYKTNYFSEVHYIKNTFKVALWHLFLVILHFKQVLC